MEAKRWAETSARLVPGGAGDGALCVYYSGVERDPVRALAYAESELRALPNDGNGYNRVANSLNAFGRAQEACALFEKGLAIDPQNFRMLHSYTVTLASLRRLKEFNELEARTLSAYGEALTRWNYWDHRFRLTGEIPKLPPEAPARARRMVMSLERRFDEALEMVDVELANATQPFDRFGVLLGRAFVLDALKRATPESVRADEAVALVDKLKPAPEEEREEHDYRRLWSAWMAGRAEAAVMAARRYVESVTPRTLLRETWYRETIVAELYARMNRQRECLDLLEKLIKVPSGITVPRLKQEPAWDNVRDDPRFRALLADPKNSAPL